MRHKTQLRSANRSKRTTSTETETQRIVRVTNEFGAQLEILLTLEGDTLLGRVEIDGIPYHVFLASVDEVSIGGKYSLDHDPDYIPRSSPNGQYLLISPYCEHPT